MNLWAWLMQCIQEVQLSGKLFVVGRALAHMGNDVYIHPSVVFNWPERIYISDECRLHQGVILNARSTHDVGIWLGQGVKIHQYSYVDPYGGYIRMEDYSGIGHHCVVGGHGGLTVGKYTMISGLTYIIPANHIFQKRDTPYVLQGETREGITIGSNVWIGAGCIILDGVSIGDNAVIGAGSVISESIPSNTLALGAPAKVVKQL